MPVPAVPTASEAVSPFAPTTSSVLPSAAIAEERIDWLIVSPVASDAVKITVASINPTTISAARPRRRLAFRTPSRKKTRLRSASTTTTASSSTSSTANTSASEPTGIPNSLLTPSPSRDRRLRDDHVVGLATRRRAVHHEIGHLLDLRLVEAAQPRGPGSLLTRPEA